jgi:hypothetical protein
VQEALFLDTWEITTPWTEKNAEISFAAGLALLVYSQEY